MWGTEKASAEPAAILFFKINGEMPPGSKDCDAKAASGMGFYFDGYNFDPPVGIPIGEGATEDINVEVKYVHSQSVFGM